MRSAPVENVTHWPDEESSWKGNQARRKEEEEEESQWKKVGGKGKGQSLYIDATSRRREGKEKRRRHSERNLSIKITKEREGEGKEGEREREREECRVSLMPSTAWCVSPRVPFSEDKNLSANIHKEERKGPSSLLLLLCRSITSIDRPIWRRRMLNYRLSLYLFSIRWRPSLVFGISMLMKPKEKREKKESIKRIKDRFDSKN